MENSVLTHLEWEVLRQPITIARVEDRTELPKGKKKIVIDRDDDYNLRATLYFKDPSFAEKLHQSQTAAAGSFPERFDVQGFCSESISCTLESCLLGSTTFHMVQEDQESPDTSEINFHGLRMRYKNENEGTHLVEWYLNGPQDYVFCRNPDGKTMRCFKGQRLFSGFLTVKACNLEFLVAKVPNGIGPTWSSNIAIEYRKAWGRIPDTDERAKIDELCSFILGRQILSIGYTVYDQNENVVEAYAVSPWGSEARSFCSKHDMPPVRISDFLRGKAEEVISQLLPTYYELREPLRLTEALWNYWISRNMPIGTNLPVLAAAVESIINGWFKHEKKSRSQGVYMKKEEFEKLLEEEIRTIRRKLSGKRDGEKIVAKILRAYECGIMERYRVFFDEIELPINYDEWEAIRNRHKFIHGHAKFDQTDWKRVIRHANTFETLFHKVLLKLLGYSGTFIDRSVLGWQDKQLS